MAQFLAFSPDVMVNGETVLAVVNGMGVFKEISLKILAENGIDNPKPGEWYSQQSWLNTFKTISEQIGQVTLHNIGKAIPENAEWPPQIDTIEKALESIDITYHNNHKNGEIGNYSYIQIDDRSAKIICNNPYPCMFDKGIIESLVKKFRVPGSRMINVKHDENGSCRTQGGDSCTYIIKW